MSGVRGRTLLAIALSVSAAFVGCHRQSPWPPPPRTSQVADLTWLGTSDKLVAAVSEEQAGVAVGSTIWGLTLQPAGARLLGNPGGYAGDLKRCGPFSFAFALNPQPRSTPQRSNLAYGDWSGFKSLTRLGHLNVGLACTPSGAEIAFTHLRNPSTAQGLPSWPGSPNPPRGIYVVEVASKRVRQFVAPSASATMFPIAWSPDGRRLLYRRNPRDFPSRGDLWVVNRTGGRIDRVTSCGDVQFRATWSPDGRSVLFVREKHAPSGRRSDLWRVDVQTLTLSPVLTWSQLHQPPGWPSIVPSPDGGQALTVDDHLTLWLTDLKTAAATRLAPAHVRTFSWSPDSKRIAYVRNETEVWVTTPGGTPKKLWVAPQPSGQPPAPH